MRIRPIIFLLVFPLMLSVPARSANRYSLERRTVEGVATFRLSDEKLNQQVSIAPEVGNVAYEFLAGGNNIFYRPAPLGELRERKILAGNPFLSPWVSRIDGEEYYVGGKKYRFNNALGNLHRDSNNRILHGLLIWSPYWKVAKSGASDAEGAYLVSRLDFYRYPDLMAQFPFAHTLEMTYRLKDGQLEVGMRVTNLAEEADLPLKVEVEVSSPLYPVRYVDVIRNGRVVSRKFASEGRTQWNFTDRLNIQQSGWLAVRAYGDMGTESHTNPVYIYMGGKLPFDDDASGQILARLDGSIRTVTNEEIVEQLKEIKQRLVSYRETGDGRGLALPPFPGGN